MGWQFHKATENSTRCFRASSFIQFAAIVSQERSVSQEFPQLWWWVLSEQLGDDLVESKIVARIFDVWVIGRACVLMERISRCLLKNTDTYLVGQKKKHRKCDPFFSRITLY